MTLRDLLLPGSQPQAETALVNSQHWLAKNLVFATDGRDGFVWHKPTAPAVYGLQSRPVVADGPLGGVQAWVPDGTNITRWGIPPIAANGTTIACWVYGVAASSTDDLVSISNSSASNGARVIRRLSTEQFSASRVNSSAASAGDASTAGEFIAGRWQFVVATFTSDTVSDLWLDGVRAAEGSANIRSATTMDTFVVGASIPNGSLFSTATTAIRGIGPAYLLDRVLSADEAAQWSFEALADPWALFEPQRIWVPRSAGGSTTYTLSAPTYVPGSITSTGLTARVTVTAA